MTSCNGRSKRWARCLSVGKRGVEKHVNGNRERWASDTCPRQGLARWYLYAESEAIEDKYATSSESR